MPDNIFTDSSPATDPTVTDPLTPDEKLDLLYEPTWWELHMLPTDHPGDDPTLLAHYREHEAIVHQRTANRPMPF